MADFVLKYADGRGQIHHQVATAGSEKELRERFSQQGFLIYSIKPRTVPPAGPPQDHLRRRKKLNLEKFLIFNQQFVTLIRAGLPILKGLDLLAERLTDPKLGPYIKAVRDEVRSGTLLSEAFRQQGIFPKMYVTSVMAGEKSGSLTEVLDRYISYQRIALAVKKKVLVSLMYPCVLIVLVILLMVFLVTYVVPDVRHLVQHHAGEAAGHDGVADRHRHHGPQVHCLFAVGAGGGIVAVPLVGAAGFGAGARSTGSRLQAADRRRHLAEIPGRATRRAFWAPCSPAVFRWCRPWRRPPIRWTRRCCGGPSKPPARACGRASRFRDRSRHRRMFPGLATDMIEVGESTGALPAMLNSVAEFFEEDVNTRMTAALSLIEPAIMIVMGSFVAFVSDFAVSADLLAGGQYSLRMKVSHGDD